jgi:hypothetical protein
MTERQIKDGKGLHKAANVTYNEQTGSQKVLGPVLGVLTRMFSFSSSPAGLPAPFANGGLIALYNPTASTAWLTIGVGATAPATPSASTGIALRPNDYTIIGTPNQTSRLACDVATVVAYVIEDDSYIG